MAARMLWQLVLKRRVLQPAVVCLPAAASFAFAPPRWQPANCISSGDRQEPDDDDDDDEFSYSFAKAPVVAAEPNCKCEVQINPGQGSFKRPLAEVTVSSTFSLPVERGWPRDTLRPEDVASSMRDVLVDRLPRWAASHYQWSLSNAPLAQRSQTTLQAWPRTDDAPVVCSSAWWPSPPLPPLIKLWLLQDTTATSLKLGGWLLGLDGSERPHSELRVEVVPLGVCAVHDDGEESGFAERLDLRLTTQFVNTPVAGAWWSLVGCGGRWWFEKVRLPAMRCLLEDFHKSVRRDMMVFYVAALAS